jgi:hypothetical protein
LVPILYEGSTHYIRDTQKKSPTLHRDEFVSFFFSHFALPIVLLEPDIVNGQLYVFGAQDNRYNTWDDIYYSDPSTLIGTFIPLEWNHTTQDEVELHQQAIEAGAFQFLRPEDGAMDKREGHTNISYMADTGSDADEDDLPIPVGDNG